VKPLVGRGSVIMQGNQGAFTSVIFDGNTLQNVFNGFVINTFEGAAGAMVLRSALKILGCVS
jgi:hypothetical protein